MAKKILAVALVAIVAVSAAACFVACEEEPTPYADLVAVRVNNFMAEWENIDYNFTYEGSSALKVSVPYTNYLEVNDLIVSPGAEYKVYEDEGKTKQLTDLSKIYVDGAKTLYIDVTNGELSNSYSVEVTVKQTNLPPESELADKQYDNRGGHIYIPDGAETVEVDGVVYNVLRVDVLLEQGQNYILPQDSTFFAGNFKEKFEGIFDGNNYNFITDARMVRLPATDRYEIATWYIYQLGEQGVVRNVVMDQPEGVYTFQGNYRLVREADMTPICRENYGTIENVYNNFNYWGARTDGLNQSLTAFVEYNYGTMKNCIFDGCIRSFDYAIDTTAKFAAFAYVNTGSMQNCVNTADIRNFNTGDEINSTGAASIVFSSRAGAEYDGVFNLGDVQMADKNGEAAKKAYGNLFFVRETQELPDMSRMKNYR